MVSDFLEILRSALLPILTIVGFGYALHRWRPMESKTLVTLNLYFFVPVYLFVRVLESTLSWADIGKIGVLVLVPLVSVGALAFAVLRKTSLPSDTIAAVLIGGLFANAGNFGVPVAEIVFDAEGSGIHAVIMLFANFSIFSIAFAILAMGRGQGFSAILHYFKLPYLYCILGGLLIRDLSIPVPIWITNASHTIADGLVPIALATLGTQLATHARWPRWSVIAPAVALKLIVMPIVSLLFMMSLGQMPLPGTVVVLAACAPTAINPLLLAMQLEGDTETLSDCVFWTTLFSAVTVAIWLTILKGMSAEVFV